MDDLNTYGDYFEEGIEKLEKFHIMMKKGIMLGHLLLFARIPVDPVKVEVILNFPTPKKFHQLC